MSTKREKDLKAWLAAAVRDNRRLRQRKKELEKQVKAFEETQGELVDALRNARQAAAYRVEGDSKSQAIPTLAELKKMLPGLLEDATQKGLAMLEKEQIR